mgnify:CR=1 FL=1
MLPGAPGTPPELLGWLKKTFSENHRFYAPDRRLNSTFMDAFKLLIVGVTFLQVV